MKLAFLMLICIAAVYSFTLPHIMECRWYNSKCVEKCPDGLIEVTGDCNMTYWAAQRTCQKPQLQYVGFTCGFSRCDCPEPTVLDTDTGFCYDIDNCPTKHRLTGLS